MHDSESTIQKAVFAHLRQCAAPGAVFWHCPNGPEARRKSGYLEGASDVMVLHNREFFALELKAIDGDVRPAQMEFIKSVQKAGGEATFSFGLDPALATLRAWGVLR